MTLTSVSAFTPLDCPASQQSPRCLLVLAHTHRSTGRVWPRDAQDQVCVQKDRGGEEGGTDCWCLRSHREAQGPCLFSQMGGLRLGGGEGPTQGLMVTEGAGRRGGTLLVLSPSTPTPLCSMLGVSWPQNRRPPPSRLMEPGSAGTCQQRESRKWSVGKSVQHRRHMCSPALTAGRSTDNLTALMWGFRLITALGISPGFSPGLSWEFAGEVRGLL